MSFATEHPWMMFLSIIFFLIILDNALTNFSNAYKYRGKNLK